MNNQSNTLSARERSMLRPTGDPFRRLTALSTSAPVGSRAAHADSPRAQRVQDALHESAASRRHRGLDANPRATPFSVLRGLSIDPISNITSFLERTDVAALAGTSQATRAGVRGDPLNAVLIEAWTVREQAPEHDDDLFESLVKADAARFGLVAADREARANALHDCESIFREIVDALSTDEEAGVDAISTADRVRTIALRLDAIRAALASRLEDGDKIISSIFQGRVGYLPNHFVAELLDILELNDQVPPALLPPVLMQVRAMLIERQVVIDAGRRLKQNTTRLLGLLCTSTMNVGARVELARPLLDSMSRSEEVLWPETTVGLHLGVQLTHMSAYKLHVLWASVLECTRMGLAELPGGFLIREIEAELRVQAPRGQDLFHRANQARQAISTSDLTLLMRTLLQLHSSVDIFPNLRLAISLMPVQEHQQLRLSVNAMRHTDLPPIIRLWLNRIAAVFDGSDADLGMARAATLSDFDALFDETCDELMMPQSSVDEHSAADRLQQLSVRLSIIRRSIASGGEDADAVLSPILDERLARIPLGDVGVLRSRIQAICRDAHAETIPPLVLHMLVGLARRAGWRAR